MPVMDDAKLCQAVSEKVMGLPRIDTWYPNTSDLELSWSDAGRVVERMRELGYDFTVSVESHQSHKFLVLFGKVRRTTDYTDGTYDAWDSSHESFPRAVFEAALKAVEARDAS